MTEIDTNANECDSEAETEVDESEINNDEEMQLRIDTDDNDNDGDNNDAKFSSEVETESPYKCGAPECNHPGRFKSQRELEEHWGSNMECLLYNIQF